jgi:hypothetical protein
VVHSCSGIERMTDEEKMMKAGREKDKGNEVC